MRYVVLSEKLQNDCGSLDRQLLNSLNALSFDNDFNKSDAVFIKPNLTYPVYRKGATTRKEFVESLVATLRKVNSRTKIYIGEGEGGYNSFSMSDAMRAMGYYKIESKYPNVKIVNLSKLPTRQVELRAKGKPYVLNLPELFFNEIDFSITCPLPKVHCMTQITLALKNQWGCIPDVLRLKNHYVFDEIICQVCEKLKFCYAFLDGKYGLDNNGPMVGDPVEVNWFVASNSLGAFDMIVSEMMGFDWRRIGHLRMAAKYGFIPEREDIEIIGDMNSLRREFMLKRNFWNYPALAAFHSRKLTHLFYFSRWAGFLHDVMYMFRKRPIS